MSVEARTTTNQAKHQAKKQDSPLNQQTRAKLEQVSTATLATALLKRSLHHQANPGLFQQWRTAAGR